MPKKTLAIIDDDTELLGELSRALGSSFHVTTSLGDPGTMRMLKDDPPAAVVLDLDLDTFDPYELLRLMSGDPALRGTPVLALSSASDFASFEHAHRAGAADYVTKPFSPDDLGAKLGALIARPHAAHQRPPQARRPPRRQRPGHRRAARGRAGPPERRRRPPR